MRSGARLSLGFALALSGCSEKAVPTPRALESRDHAIQVEDETVPPSWVDEVARAGGAPPSVAASAIADDMRLSVAAKRAHLDETPESKRGTLAARARSTIRQIYERARSTKPTDEEVKALSKERWRQVDLPETRVVVHAVALRPKKETPESLTRAKALAAALLERVSRAANETEFESLANSLSYPHEASELVVQPLPPFTVDGRIATEEGALDPGFTRAAFQIDSVGKTSGIVESPFGWHVIRLISVRAPVFVPFEERRTLFEGEILNRRARAEIERITAEWKGRYPVEISSAADTVLAEFHRR